MIRIQNKSLWSTAPDKGSDDSVTVGQALELSAQKYPDQEFIVYAHQPDQEDIRWSYKELNEHSTTLAASLLQSGYEPGDKVAVWGANYPEWILLEFALAKAGLVLVALNPLYKAQELIFALNTTQSKGLFHADLIRGESVSPLVKSVRSELTSLKFVHSFTEGLQKLLSLRPRVDGDLLNQATPDSVQMIQLTSGTTGSPKAAQLSHSAVTMSAKYGFRACGFESGDRICLGFPLFHIGGSGYGVIGSVMAGATLLPLLVFKPKIALDILEKERCTVFTGVPSMLIAMLEDETFPSRDLSALRFISVGGAPVPTKLILKLEDAFQAEIANGYGQTECSGLVTTIQSNDSTELKSSTCGRALPGVSLKIVDTKGEIVDIGDTGELCYSGPGKMLGYLNRDNDETIDQTGWLHTGDLAKMDEQGYISIVGRLKDIIIRGGENISPTEIENILLKHPDISEVSVFGIPDEKHGEIVCAAIRSNESGPASIDEIKHWCRDSFSLWKIPEHMMFVDTFPTTPSGKIQKFVLREQLLRVLKNS